MGNNYQKLTKKTFVQRVKEGVYANAVAAKRGLGRAALSDDDKKSCLRAIAKHLGDAPAKKATKKKAPAKKKPAAKKKAVKAKPAKKAAVKKAPATKKKKATKRKAEKLQGVAHPDPNSPWGAPEMQEKLAQVGLAREQIGTTAQAIAAMKMAKEVNPDLDVKEGSESSQRILTHAVAALEETLPDGRTEGNGASTTLPQPAPYTPPAAVDASDSASNEVPTAADMEGGSAGE